MTLITCRIFAFKRFRNAEIRRVSPMNQRNEADTTPKIKGKDWEAGRVTWKAPSIMVPSMIAWGLNQVTTKAEEIVFCIESAEPPSDSSVTLDLSRQIPMYMTIRLPPKRTAICSHGYSCMTSPIPKKQDRDKVASKKITINAVSRARRRPNSAAALMTNRFCGPMGAT